LYHRRTNPKTFTFSRELRHDLTPAEAKLWKELRAHRFAEVHFRRQHAIGPYVVDFCAPRQKLIIELDGSQHHDQQEYDTERTTLLEAKGYRVLRFWNAELTDGLDGVCQVIWDALEGNLPER
jgi:very-short-patch-repair endonuclease